MFFAAPTSIKMHPETPKRPQEAFQKPQNDPKCTPKRHQEAPKSDQKTKPNRKLKKGPNQDDPKTVLDPPRADLPSSAAPPGSIWEPKTTPKPIPKRSKIEAKIKEATKSDPRRSWTRLGAILGRSWPHLGVIFGQKPEENVLFREKSLFRR